MTNDTIDVQKGLGFLAGEKSIYIKVANTFLNGSAQKIEDLKTYYAEGDFERLKIEFHGLKSSAATIGSTLLPQISRELEKAGADGDIDFINENFNEFIRQYEDTCVALREAVTQLTSE